MDPNYSWIYLAIFLVIPLARLLPRLVAKMRANRESTQIPEEHQQQASVMYQEPPPESKPKTKNMLVLGALNRGSNTFESIQKNTGLGSKELETILEDLEKNGMLSVRQKQGMLGPKIELYPTDKGFKTYYS